MHSSIISITTKSTASHPMVSCRLILRKFHEKIDKYHVCPLRGHDYVWYFPSATRCFADGYSSYPPFGEEAVSKVQFKAELQIPLNSIDLFFWRYRSAEFVIQPWFRTFDTASCQLVSMLLRTRLYPLMVFRKGCIFRLLRVHQAGCSGWSPWFLPWYGLRFRKFRSNAPWWIRLYPKFP